MITFNTNSYIQPIYPITKTNNTRNKRSQLLYVTYRCPICGLTHTRLMSESYMLKDIWYCKECVDSLI